MFAKKKILKIIKYKKNIFFFLTKVYFGKVNKSDLKESAIQSKNLHSSNNFKIINFL